MTLRSESALKSELSECFTALEDEAIGDDDAEFIGGMRDAFKFALKVYPDGERLVNALSSAREYVSWGDDHRDREQLGWSTGLAWSLSEFEWSEVEE